MYIDISKRASRTLIIVTVLITRAQIKKARTSNPYPRRRSDYDRDNSLGHFVKTAVIKAVGDAIPPVKPFKIPAQRSVGVGMHRDFDGDPGDPLLSEEEQHLAEEGKD